jgi:hypothetical protein
MMKVKSNRSKKSKNYADPEGAVFSTRWIESSPGILGLRRITAAFFLFLALPSRRRLGCYGLSGKEFCEYATSSSFL